MHPTCIRVPGEQQFLKHNPLAVAGEVLVLAGDIGYIGDENYSRHPFWDWASGNYSRVIVVPGNHEFYKMFDIDKLYNGWSLKIRKTSPATIMPLSHWVTI